MRAPRGGSRLPAVPSSLTRRQLLIRTGGASVALAGLGLLPRDAAADPAALTGARRATYAALLESVDASPAYELADRDAVAALFDDIYATADAPFRAYAEVTLDALAPVGLEGAGAQLAIDALSLVKRPFVGGDDDNHQILFSV
jgi:hypothetical protein